MFNRRASGRSISDLPIASGRVISALSKTFLKLLSLPVVLPLGYKRRYGKETRKVLDDSRFTFPPGQLGNLQSFCRTEQLPLLFREIIYGLFLLPRFSVLLATRDEVPPSSSRHYYKREPQPCQVYTCARWAVSEGRAGSIAGISVLVSRSQVFARTRSMR
jgi:hypothetical protein